MHWWRVLGNANIWTPPVLQGNLTWVKARKAPRVYLHTMHPDGVWERRVWYFAKRKSLGHHHHCETCHPRYRNGRTRVRVKRFMFTTGLPLHRKQSNTVVYDEPVPA